MKPLRLLGALLLASLPAWAQEPVRPPGPPALTVRGTVRDERGPVPGAVVRFQASESSTVSGPDGAFALSGLSGGQPVVTAWSEGCYVGWAAVPEDGAPVLITLTRHYTGDNADYAWFAHEGEAGSRSCSHCMPSFPEWAADAHSRAATNPLFTTMYEGTDTAGNRSPPTRYRCDRDYGCQPLRPDPAQPYFGPGYKLDFPGSPGNCAACHAPAAAARNSGAYSGEIGRLTAVEREGVFCEYCHKVGGVRLDPRNGLPFPNMPGVLSQRLYRPAEGQQLFFGQFDDVTRRVTRLPLIEQSAFCAPCHYGVFWDTVVYNSFGEWLQSPYSDPRSGKTCQDCHMPLAGYDFITLPEKGGLRRNPLRVLSHRMPGATDVALLQGAVRLDVEAVRSAGGMEVRVGLTNQGAGHHVPTDSPLRHLILLVEAVDERGGGLPLRDGPRLPEWAGVGDPARGYYAGLPGKAFAKVLKELWTGVAPTGAYWNQTSLVSDTRLAAGASDASRYLFAVPAAGAVRVTATLVFRRAFIALRDWKSWTAPDIVMARRTLTR